MLRYGACERVLILAVETFAECADLFGRARWLARGPFVERRWRLLGTAWPGPAPSERHGRRGGASWPSSGGAQEKRWPVPP